MELKIQKTDKIIIIFYAFLAIAFVIGILYIASTFDTIEQSIIFPQPVTELQITKIVDVNQEEAFLIMTDIKNYPKILPRNIISVNIINQIDNDVLAEYEVVEHGIRTKLLVSHTMYPYDKHIVEVMDGDAKGTKLIQDFTTVNAATIVPPKCIDRDMNDDEIIDENDMQICKEYTWKEEGWGDCPFLDECTKIDSRIELNLEGLLSPFSYLPKRNLEHASDTVISTFTDYMEIKTENGRIIDELYREILLRPADKEAFEYWGTLLENEIITKIELRKDILKSQEAISLKTYSGELSETIYNIFHEVYELNGPYREILIAPDQVGSRMAEISAFDPRIDRDEFKKMVKENKYRVQIEDITLDELRLEFEQLKENGTDFFVDDLEAVNEQFLDWQKHFVDRMDSPLHKVQVIILPENDFCYTCKWGTP